VDLSSGKSVRLSQADLGSAEYDADPYEIVQTFVNDGARWIHLADLDQAFGKGHNQEVIASVVSDFTQTNFQLSGGISGPKTLEIAMAQKPSRVNLSSASLGDLNWLKQVFEIFPEVLAFGLDVLDGRVIPRGSSQDFGSLEKVLDELNDIGVKQYVVTDVSRDGMLSGPNLGLLREVFEQTGALIISSGGISSLEDLESIKSLDFVDSVILGKALYVGNFTLQEALEVVSN